MNTKDKHADWLKKPFPINPSKMNTNELADALENRIATQGYEITKEAATMLRQQQAQIAALKKQLYPAPKEYLGVSPEGVLMFKEEEK